MIFAEICFAAIILAFIIFCIYGIFQQKLLEKKGRTVDANILSCEEIFVKDDQLRYFLVTVEFFSRTGEKIVKSVQSKTEYEVGAVIRSKYLDGKDQLWLGADSVLKNKKSRNKGLFTIIGFLAVFLAFVIFMFYVKNTGGETLEKFKMYFGYVIGVAFVGIGIGGALKKIEYGKKRFNMQVVEGTQVDYYVVRGRESMEYDMYYPIYEYEWCGERCRLRSNIGSNRDKARTIGRKVHMLRDPETGKFVCEEDEKKRSFVFLFFGVFGIILLCILLGGNFGLWKLQ